MIVELKKEIITKGSFEVRPSEKYGGYVLFFINDYTTPPCACYVTREELELISKAILEELKKAEG